MTIYQLALLNVANGGHFFDRDTLKHNRETMKSFSIRQEGNDKVVVYRKNEPNGSRWTFSTITGRVVIPAIRLTVQKHVVPELKA